MAEERPYVRFDDQFPDFGRCWFVVPFGLFDKIVEQFPARDPLHVSIDHFSARLAPKNLIPQPFRVLNVDRAGRLLNLPTVNPIRDVPDFAALEDGAGTIRASWPGRRIS